MSKLTGQVERVTLHRESWGSMTVLSGSSDSERAEVTGALLGVAAGDTVEVEGSWSEHPRWGRQLRASSVKVTLPADHGGAIAWLSSALTGIGRKRATAMVEAFPPPELWDVLAHDAAELVKVPGITGSGAHRIAEEYRAVMHEREVLSELRGFGLTARQAASVLQSWGAETLERLRADPYALAEISGFGFVRSDGLALGMGLPREHPSRIAAALRHIVDEQAGAGHCYVPAAKLVALAVRLLGVDASLVWAAGKEAMESGKLVQRAGNRVYSPRLAAAELSLVGSIERMVK